MAHQKLNLAGLHCHLGTFMLTSQAYGIAAAKLCDLAINIKYKWNRIIEYLDLGGGFASSNTLRGSYLPGPDLSPSFDDYAEAITTAILNSGFSQDELPTLMLETGRALIDDAGYLIGSVLANKRLSDNRRALVMDFGVNILFTAFWYEHKITPAQEFTHHSEEVVVYGPLCMNIDKIRESASLPPLNKGDKVVVHKVGAYNMTQWMQFIAMRPNVIMIDLKGEPHLIRNAESIDTLNNQEITPEYLNKIAL
jgi:diaminopimelate decarboxylase